MLNDVFSREYGLSMTPKVREGTATNFCDGQFSSGRLHIPGKNEGTFNPWYGRLSGYRRTGPVQHGYISTETAVQHFFKTYLDQTLRPYGTDTVAITGLNTHWCVLTTAMDALANDFCAYIIEDCCTSYREEIHESVINMYRANPMYPLFRIMPLKEFVSALQ